MSTILSIFIILLAFIFTTFYLKRRKINKKVSKIPEVKNQIPLLGIVHKFFNAELKDYLKIMLEIFDPNIPIQRTWFATKLAIIPNTPEQFKIIFNSPHCVNKPTIIYDGFFSKFGIISTNGEVQDKHRKILSNSMTPAMLNQLNPIFNEKSRHFVRKLSEKVDKSEFNIYHHVAACTLEALMKGQFQHDHDCYGSEVIEAFENSKEIMMRRIAQPWMSFELFYNISKLARDAKRVFDPIHKKVEEIIKVNEHLKTHNDHKVGVLISQLLNLKNEFCEEEIKDEVFIWIFGGYETTAVTLSTCLLMLAMHKDVQQKVIDEIENSNFEETFDITNEETQKFSYIELVLKETMRLFPVAPIIMRETTAEIDLEGHKIPKDTILALPIFLVHKNKKIWGNDAENFNPNRFENEKIKELHPYAFIPFSGGKRMCLGYKYAMFFMKIFIVNFFKRFEIETGLKFNEIELQVTPTMSVIQGYQVRVKEKRKAKVNDMLVEKMFTEVKDSRENYEKKRI